jgi:hypothetical protein
VDDFDWVTAQAGCTTVLMFKRLQDGARKEVDLRCLAQHASGEDVNAANNPLTPKITTNFHDQWAPELYDLDEVSNELLFRGLIPDSAARASSFATRCQWSPRPIGRGHEDRTGRPEHHRPLSLWVEAGAHGDRGGLSVHAANRHQ